MWLLFHTYRYSTLLQYASVQDLNKLEEEFLQYQLMNDSDIPFQIWQEALVKEDKDDDVRKYRMDVIWSFLNTIKNPDGKLIFERLAKVALLVLTIPHSNAQEERVFSLVTKNKTKFRPNLKLDGTLASILTIKLANAQPCHKFEPPQEVIESAKTATMIYNQAHSSKSKTVYVYTLIVLILLKFVYFSPLLYYFLRFVSISHTLTLKSHSF